MSATSDQPYAGIEKNERYSRKDGETQRICHRIEIPRQKVKGVVHSQEFYVDAAIDKELGYGDSVNRTEAVESRRRELGIIFTVGPALI